jgi:predicted nucleotidyltransferase
MEAYLEELLGVEVQLTTIEALRPEFRERVMREAIPL